MTILNLLSKQRKAGQCRDRRQLGPALKGPILFILSSARHSLKCPQNTPEHLMQEHPVPLQQRGSQRLKLQLLILSKGSSSILHSGDQHCRPHPITSQAAAPFAEPPHVPSCLPHHPNELLFAVCVETAFLYGCPRRASALSNLLPCHSFRVWPICITNNAA